MNFNHRNLNNVTNDFFLRYFQNNVDIDVLQNYKSWPNTSVMENAHKQQIYEEFLSVSDVPKIVIFRISKIPFHCMAKASLLEYRKVNKVISVCNNSDPINNVLAVDKIKMPSVKLAKARSRNPSFSHIFQPAT